MNGYRKEDFDFCNTYMLPDERIIWKGKPANPEKLMISDKASILFGLFWLGFSIFWCIMASFGGGNVWMFGLLFVAIGIYIAFIAPAFTIYERKNTSYVITNEKIMCKVGNKVKTMDGRDNLKLNIFGDANGKIATIYFGEKLMYRKSGRTRVSYSGAFPMINVPIKEVQAAIDEMRDGFAKNINE